MGVVALHPDLPLETERLLLRGFELSDEDALLDLHRREDVARYLYNEPMSREDVRETLVRRIGATGLDADSHALRLAVVLRDGGLLIGDVSLRLTSGDHAQGEIGFVFNPDHHGHGYATEAGHALLGLGFEAVGMHRIVGRTEARNVASARVLERLGMRREAHLLENEFVKGEWQSELVYAMLAAEWNARV